METNLEQIIPKFISEKERRLEVLQKRLDILNGHNGEISYSDGLTREEQIKYAKIGLFYLWYDIQNYSLRYRKHIK